MAIQSASSQQTTTAQQSPEQIARSTVTPAAAFAQNLNRGSGHAFIAGQARAALAAAQSMGGQSMSSGPASVASACGGASGGASASTSAASSAQSGCASAPVAHWSPGANGVTDPVPTPVPAADPWAAADPWGAASPWMAGGRDPLWMAMNQAQQPDMPAGMMMGGAAGAD